MSHKGPWRERRLRVRRNPDGSEAGTFDLKIRKTGPVYDLSYNRDGKLLFLGVGIDTSDGIAAGYGKAEWNMHERVQLRDGRGDVVEK